MRMSLPAARRAMAILPAAALFLSLCGDSRADDASAPMNAPLPVERPEQENKAPEAEAPEPQRDDQSPGRKPSEKEGGASQAKRSLPPLKEMITSRFGERRMSFYPLGSSRLHHGIDIRAHQNWPVVSLKNGVVRFAGPHGAAGIMVDIEQEDGMTARYAHLNAALVTAGQKVSGGEKIGLVGCTGRTTGSHLHFGLYSGRHEPVDPLPYLERAEDILRPEENQIPETLSPQSCGGRIYGAGPVIRGRNGRPTRLPSLRSLDSYSPSPIPLWQGRARPRRR